MNKTVRDTPPQHLPLQLSIHRARLDDRVLHLALVCALDPVARIGNAEQTSRSGCIEFREDAAVAPQPHGNIDERIAGLDLHERHAQVVWTSVGRKRRTTVDTGIAANV